MEMVLYVTKFILGFCHLAIRQVRHPAFVACFFKNLMHLQEDVSIGCEFGINKHVYFITYGELLGRQTHISRGRCGTLHIFTHNPIVPRRRWYHWSAGTAGVTR
jgi:hypothetical protein